MSGRIIERSLVRRLVRMPGAGLSRTRGLSQSQGPKGTPGGERLRLFEADDALASGEMGEPGARVLGTENSNASTPGAGAGAGVHRRTLQNRAPECAYGDLG